MKLSMTVKERLGFKTIFPTKGDLFQQVLVKDISERMDVKREDLEKMGIKVTPMGYTWDKEIDANVEKEVKEFDFSDTEIRFLKEQVKRLDSEKNITQGILDLCLKIQDCKAKEEK